MTFYVSYNLADEREAVIVLQSLFKIELADGVCDSRVMVALQYTKQDTRKLLIVAYINLLGLPD